MVSMGHVVFVVMDAILVSMCWITVLVVLVGSIY